MIYWSWIGLETEILRQNEVHQRRFYIKTMKTMQYQALTNFINGLRKSFSGKEQLSQRDNTMQDHVADQVF